MTEIGNYIRIFNANPDDDFVSKRIEAIKSIEQNIEKKERIDNILQLANAIADALGNLSESNTLIAEYAEDALRQQSPSFVSEGQQLQILTCTLVAALQHLEKVRNQNTPLSIVDVFGLALWSCLSFQPYLTESKLESLRMDILKRSKDVLSKISLASRSRKEVKKPEAIVVPNDGNMQSLASNIESSYGKIIANTLFNSILDREEIDILWWVLADWSDVVNLKINELNPVQNAIVSGIEISRLLRRVPAESHYHLAKRSIDPSESFDSKELLEKMADINIPIQKFLAEFNIITQNPKIFPLFNLLLSGNLDSSTSGIKRTLDEWTGRALLEGALINLDRFFE